MNWGAITLFSLSQAGLLSLWLIMGHWGLLGNELPVPLLAYLFAYLFPVFMIGVIVKSRFFLHGCLVAVFGSLLGFIAMFFSSLIFIPSGEDPVGIGQAVVEIASFAALFGLIFSPFAGLFSDFVGNIRNKNSDKRKSN